MPTTVLKGDDLRLKIGDTIGKTLEQELGVANQSFGPGVGRPMIRGQSGPRVRVLDDDIGSNDASSISPDHAVSTEPLLADRIEVLRGPEATLLYGSGAMGGAVNVISNRIPEDMLKHRLGGAIEQRYDSTTNETATVAKIEGGQGPIAIHLDGFYRDHGNMVIGGQAIDEAAARFSDPTLPAQLENSKGVLPNSRGTAISGSAGFSWIGDIGFAGASVNHLFNDYGIPINGTGDDITRIHLQQNRYDFKSKLDNPVSFAQSLVMRLGYTDYQHAEITNNIVSDFFANKTYEGRVELTHQPIGLLHGVVGFHGIASDFSAIDKSDGDILIPHSQINNFGLFVVENFDLGALSYQLGLRVENDRIAPDAKGSSSFNYTPVSFSASGLWEINDQHNLSLAFTRSQRSPQVQELLFNGFHDATRSFELGNPNLTTETFHNLDLGYHFQSDWMQAEIDLFQNWASDYITQQRNGQFVTEEGDPCPMDTLCPPVVVTSQANAVFKGFEGKLIFPVMENHQGAIKLTLFSDYTRGQFTHGADIPRMPPLRYGLQLDYAKAKFSSNVRLTRAETQKHAGQFEAPTPGYILLNLGAQYQVKAGQDIQLLAFARGTNLLNQNIRNSTSYLRNFAPEAGRGAEIGIRVNY
ncbi:TonB-dependent receptor [Candidatus Nitrosoglobus terrae]|uniref:TonB-dependent receptor n=1 Tax=Candidatus Nitrosoglobus terrae TaxID=1630141 RepID=A0A1Q2SKH4_9GAMM|nr:TonB-dependent receptor [Candidatus Nitrosoglobus terrae]BAW79620.1 TonB-dependent receptor [Candidatus Nitrosoglobus terrae]